ncbi:MAG: diguanylate cyclase, partial [Coriobacteriia bacterium]|nr:diguanylate cyclase [Coriobacteriia bacterium]
VVVDGVEVSVTASIGIAAFDHTVDDADSLLAKADGAMYDAKRAGVVWSVSGEQMSLGAA